MCIGLLIFYLYKNVEIPIVLIATGVSISIGLRQYNIENDRMFKELFTSFNTKYDEKFNDVLNIIDNKFNSKKGYKLSPKKILILNDYLNLCAEEYLWYKKGRIDEDAWKSWEVGMKYYLNIPVIYEFISNQINQKDSYYGLFDKLKL